MQAWNFFCDLWELHRAKLTCFHWSYFQCIWICAFRREIKTKLLSLYLTHIFWCTVLCISLITSIFLVISDLVYLLLFLCFMSDLLHCITSCSSFFVLYMNSLYCPCLVNSQVFKNILPILPGPISVKLAPYIREHRPQSCESRRTELANETVWSILKHLL